VKLIERWQVRRAEAKSASQIKKQNTFALRRKPDFCHRNDMAET
jgi:hypothetical protein